MSEQELIDKSVGVMFDGQGVFQPGMGEAAYSRYAAAREVFKDASEAVGINMASVCFGDLTYLQDDPRVIQPAIVTVDLAEYAAWRELNNQPDVVTGLSLGYYAAMGAAEVFESTADTVATVAKRAQLMFEVSKKHPGVMAGVVGLVLSELEPLLTKTGAEIAVIRNRVRQSFVVTGSPAQVQETEMAARKSGVRKWEYLKIPGRFHSKQNEEAKLPFQQTLAGLSLSDPKIKLLGNNGNFLQTASEASTHAVEQLVNHADWDAVTEVLANLAIDTVVEFGPDESRGLARQMQKNHKIKTQHFPPRA